MSEGNRPANTVLFPKSTTCSSTSNQQLIVTASNRQHLSTDDKKTTAKIINCLPNRHVMEGDGSGRERMGGKWREREEREGSVVESKNPKNRP